MQSFDIDVFSRGGAWLIRVGDRVMSGAATRQRAERIARLAADNLAATGFGVRLTVEGAAAESFPPRNCRAA